MYPQYVLFKFKSQVDYEFLPIDGINISVGNLKKEIIKRKKLGQKQDVDLKIIDYCTHKLYNDDNTMINSYRQLIVIRVPSMRPRNKTLQSAKSGKKIAPDADDPRMKVVDLVNVDMPEQDKLCIMMAQSTYDYKASNYTEDRGTERKGPVPGYYRCHKCHHPGHWISDCPLKSTIGRVKKCSGIPRDFMVPVEGPEVRGALLTAAGNYAVPSIDYQFHNRGKGDAAPSSTPSIVSKIAPSVASVVAPKNTPTSTLLLTDEKVTQTLALLADEPVYVSSYRPVYPRGNIWKRRRYQPYSSARPTVMSKSV